MKKILFKKTSKVYRIITFAMILTILISSIPSVAITNSTGNLRRIQLSSGKTVTLTEQQFADIIEITQEEAIIIANGFICDMIAAGIVEWNEQTEVISVVPMYDNSNTDTVTAYTINLTQGYIVVSAFRDTYNLIPEWSDKSEPLYESIEHSDNQKIIYLGLYEYYIDTDIDNAIGLGNVTVNKSQIVDNITPNRSLDCIPDSVFEVASSSEANNTKSDNRDPVISNIITHANSNYAGPFVVQQTVDYWSSYIPYYTMDYGLNTYGFSDCCGPAAFTNLVGAYKNRYPWAGNDLLRGFSNLNQLFADILTVGLNEGYYIPKFAYPNAKHTGTINRFDYIPNLLNRYAMWSNYYIYSDTTGGIGSYDALYAHLQDNRLIDIALESHHIYKNHEIICHGVTRLQSTTTNAYLSYMHIADGLNTSTRYITVASAMNFKTVSVEFLGV